MTHTETEEDAGGVRCGDHLPLHKYIKNSSDYGTIPIEKLLKDSRRPQTSQKGKPISLGGVRAKDKDIKRDKGFQIILRPEGVVKEEKFPHFRKPPHRRGRGLWNFRVEWNSGCSEDRKIHCRSHCQTAFLAKKELASLHPHGVELRQLTGLHLQQRAGAGC